MDRKTKIEKQSDQFKINVNNLVTILLENNVFVNKRSINERAIKLIREKFGVSERQAHRYLREVRKEILKTSEELKQIAINKAYRKSELNSL